MKIVLWVFLLVSRSSCFAIDLVFVQLGEKVPDCLFSVMEQACCLNEDSSVYLLVDQEAYPKVIQSVFIKKKRAKVVQIEDIPLQEEHRRFKKMSSLRGFSLYTLERFFVLFDFLVWSGLKEVVHLENDTMLYVDLRELEPCWQKVALAAPFLSKVAAVPCLVFIREAPSLQPLLAHMLEVCQQKGVHDMEALATFYARKGDAFLMPLPTLVEKYRGVKRKSLFFPDNFTSLSFLSHHAFLFHPYLFDAATLGVFLEGNDPSVFQGRGAKTVHYRSLFDPTSWIFFWGQDSKKRRVPYAYVQGKEYRIVNLHFHSKQVKGYTSYDPFFTPFPER